MSSLDKSVDIPTSVNSLEKLLFWSCSLAHKLYSSTQYQVSDTTNASVAQFTIARDNNNQLRMYAIVAVPVSEDYISTVGSLRPWQYATDIGTVAIPTSFKS